MIEFIDKIQNYSVISIIGLAKNVSKTTTLNYLIKELKDKFTLGLTSIGRDGEEYDVITELPKPRIYIEEGMYIVTTKWCFEKSKIPMELIKNTGFETPLGEVIILKSLGHGLIELAGPSINKQLNMVCTELKRIGCNLILIDGAFDRKSFATPLISDGTIISTGASVSESMEEVVNLTYHTVKLFTLENEKDKQILTIAQNIIEKNKIGIINKDHSIKLLDLLTSLDSSKEIINNLDKNSKYIVIKGAITDKFLEDILKSTEKYKDVVFLAEDATKLFLDIKVLEKFQKKKGTLKVITPIKIIAITINPTSPHGYKFNRIEFLNKLRKKIDLPVYDVVANE